jgi:NifU-like protein involved in Fe-S cluster formation
LRPQDAIFDAMISNLYQRNILALAAEARGAGRLPHPDGTADLRNPLCGDHVILDIAVSDGRIGHIGHDIKACVLCQASASILCEIAAGLTDEDLKNGIKAVTVMLKEGVLPSESPWEAYRDFAAIAPHGNRHRCVLLPLEAARDALEEALSDA